MRKKSFLGSLLYLVYAVFPYAVILILLLGIARLISTLLIRLGFSLTIWVYLILILGILIIFFLLVKRAKIKELERDAKRRTWPYRVGRFFLKYESVNEYVVLTVFLVTIFLMIGVPLISSYFVKMPAELGAPFMLKNDSEINNAIASLDSINCSSALDYDDFVENDTLVCVGSSGGARKLTAFSVHQSNGYLRTNDIKDINLSGRTNVTPIDNNSFTFRFNLESSGLKNYYIFYYFENYNSSQPMNYAPLAASYLRITILTAKEAQEKTDLKIPWLLAFMTFTFFTVMGGVNSLKNLMEKKEK